MTILRLGNSSQDYIYCQALIGYREALIKAVTLGGYYFRPVRHSNNSIKLMQLMQQPGS